MSLFNEEYRKQFQQKFGPPEIKLNGMAVKFWLQKHLDIKQYLYKIFNSQKRYKSFGNFLWAFRRDFDINKHLCKTCGKSLNLKIFPKLNQYCCTKCAMTNQELIEKRNTTIAKDPQYYNKIRKKIERTSLKKYGTKVPMQSDIVKKNLSNALKSVDWDKRYDKSKITCQKRYGVQNPSQLDQIKYKKATTTLSHYGVKVPVKSVEIKNKIEKTCQEKYGVKCILQRQDVIAKALDKSWKSIDKWKEFITPNFTREQWYGTNKDIEYSWKCEKCGNIFNQRIYGTKFNRNFQRLPRCLKCYPLNPSSSVKEKLLANFCRQYFPNLKQNNRTLIAPYQVDILIEDIKLAIQFNGCYWHSLQAGTPLGYHLKKTEMAQAKGYRLIHIFEFDLLDDLEIVKKRLKAIFDGNQIIDRESKLDRCWYSSSQCSGMKSSEPEIIEWNGLHIQNCGYFYK